MASSLRSGLVTQVTSDGVWVEIPELAPHQEFGPMEIGPFTLAAGDRVLVAQTSGAMEDFIVICPMQMEYTAPPVAPIPPVNDKYLLYFENTAARTAAALTLTSGLATWLDDERRLEIYTDEPTAGWVSFYGSKDGIIAIPAGIVQTMSVSTAVEAALALTSTASGSHGAIDFASSDLFTYLLASIVSGDVDLSFGIYSDGYLEWGDNGSADTNLYRNASNELKTDSNFSALGNITTAGNLRALGSERVDVATGIAADPVSNARLYIERDSASRRGVYVKNLGTTGNFEGLVVETTSATATGSALRSNVTGDANSRFSLRNDGAMFFGDGGASLDTNLYRSAANTLKTDDNFEVAQGFLVTGNLTVGGIGKKIFKTRTTDATAIQNNTTLANDSVLASIALDVGTWLVEFELLFVSDATADFKTAWAFTGTTTGAKHVFGPGNTNTGAVTAVTPMRMAGHSITTNVVYGTTGTSSFAARETGVLIVTVAGNLSYQWAQNANAAIDTFLAGGSYVKAERMI